MCVLGLAGWSVTMLWSVYCSVDSVCVVIGGLECDGVVVSLLQCR